MSSYNAGSVSAEIILNTEQFDKSIAELKEKLSSLKSEFKKNNVQNLTDQVKQLENELKNAGNTVNTLKEQVDSLKKDNNDFSKSIENVNKELKNNQETLDNTIKKNKDVVKSQDNVNSSLEKTQQEVKKTVSSLKELKNNPTYEFNSYSNNWDLTLSQLEQAKVALDTFNRSLNTTKIDYEALAREEEYWQRRQSNLRNAMESFVSLIRLGIIEQRQLFATSEGGYSKYIETLGKVSGAFGKVNNATKTVISLSEPFNVIQAKLRSSTTLFKTFTQEVDGEMVTVRQAVGRVSEVLSTFNFKLIEVADSWDRGAKKAIELASAMQRMNTQGTSNWAGRSQFGYSSYVSQITQINQALQRQSQIQQQLKNQQLDQYYAKLNSATQKYWTQIKNGVINLNTYKSNLTQINKALEQQTSRTQRLATAQYKLFQQYHPYNLNYYKSNMAEINKQLDKQVTATKNASNATNEFNNNVRNSGRGLTSFNNGVVQTAHSGRILSNTLYQIRGALLSLKMILTAMGGMAVWGFMMELFNGVKETYLAKNEMEAQLNKNAKVNRGGIALFNKELDNTAKKFKKINKYSIGETVTSIGLEFNLSAQEMAKSMDVVSMIQSEYVRAGRDEADAALAVKDILQGEFQRLSRETGVGKEELLAYGWSGDKSDVQGLMDALRKAAKDRNWDKFAEKATSLNDVVTILKSRFSEFGADMLQSISPAIVGAFNIILDAVSGLQKGFEGLGSFWKTFISVGLPVGGIATAATAFMMISKNMGLADIATIGWRKSLLTTVFNLNKAEVATYGLRRALAAVITGTDGATVAEMGYRKAILGRILGVNSAVQAEHGLMSALVSNKMALKGELNVMNSAIVATGNFRQKLIYLTSGVIVADKQTATWGKTIKSIITSTKLWGMALKGIILISVISWLAEVVAWTDKAKKAVEGFYNVRDNGAELITDAQKTYEGYVNQVSNLNQQIAEYNAQGKPTIVLENRKAQALQNQYQAYKNLGQIQRAYNQAQENDRKNQARRQHIDLKHQTATEQAFMAGGMDRTKATEMANDYWNEVVNGNYYINKGLDAYDKRLYQSTQHLNEHVGQLKEAKATQDQINQYMIDYNTVAGEAADHWRQFNEGDINAGLYAVLDELKLAWIDIANNPQVVELSKNFAQAWSEFQPTLKQITDGLHWLADGLISITNTLLSSKGGRDLFTNGILGGLGIFAALKIGKKLTGSGSIIEFLKKIKDKAPDAVDWLKKLKDRLKGVGETAEEVGETTTNGDITDIINYRKNKRKIDNPTDDIPDAPDTDGGDKIGRWQKFKNQIADDAAVYGRIAFGIAAASVLITEAILAIIPPLWALSEVGKYFKAKEKSIRAGIEGLQLVAPTILAFLIPITALMVIVGKFSDVITPETIGKGFIGSAIGIAAGLVLVAEAIVMFYAPMWALAEVGKGFTGMKQNVQQGIEAIKAVTDALEELAPWIPVFIAGIALGITMITVPEIGIPALIAAATGIAIGIGLVAEAVDLMRVPLNKVGELGRDFPDLTAIEHGAETIKVAGEALKYLNDAFGSMVGLEWNSTSLHVLSFFGADITKDLTNLMADEGFITQLNSFVDAFNQAEIKQIDTNKVNALKTTGEGIKTVYDAVNQVYMSLISVTTMGGFAGLLGLINAAFNGGEMDIFKQILTPISKLSEFSTSFNSEDFPVVAPDTAKIETLKQTATAFTEIKTAIDAISKAMSGVYAANMQGGAASGGAFGMIASSMFGSLLPGGSGLEAGLNELYNAVKAVMDFNSKLAQLTVSSEGVDTSGIQNSVQMTSALQTEINNLNNTLSTAVPTIRTNAKGLGGAVINGFKEGLGSLGNAVTEKVSNGINAAKPTAATYGKGLGWNAYNGFKEGIKPMSDAVNDEINEILDKLSNTTDIYNKAKALGEAASNGFNDGLDKNSPGLMARAISDEISLINGYLSNAAPILSGIASALGDSISGSFANGGFFSGITDSIGGLFSGNITLPSFDYTSNSEVISQFITDLQRIGTESFNVSTLTQQNFTNMETTTNSKFSSMGTAVSNAFNTIKNNASSSYQQINDTTRTNLSSMQSQTTRNIGSIRTSWRGMQDALIASAEHIRSQTTQKINTLQSNMGSFWRKIQNPALLLGGSAGSPSEVGHTIRRRSPPKISTPNSSKGSSRRLYAGDFKTGQSQTGISSKFKSKIGGKFLLDYLGEYLAAISKDGYAYAGGWNFNWSKSIKDNFLRWHTHFGEIYDDVLTVGKFENDSFPVRGNATIAKRYIYDAISRTSYGSYFNSNFGDNPLSAWLSGVFNCWDGANVIIALANAFGFGGGYKGHGSWDGVGHVWAVVPGLGIMDATAIQRGYGFTSPKVSGYSAGTIKRGGSKGAPNSSSNDEKVVNVTIDMSNSTIYGVDDLEKRMEEASEKVVRKHFTNPTTVPF